jgi:hypothetical protein
MIAHRARQHVDARRPREVVSPTDARATQDALRGYGEIDGVMAVRVEGARITGLYDVRNPHELTHIASETPLELR